MKTRKTVISLIAVMFLLVNTMGITAHASAVDYQIKNFTIKALTYTQVGNPRSKDNSTSVYCYIRSAGNSVKAQTWGSSASTLHKNLTLNRNGKSVTAVGLKIGVEYQIYNKIKESGYAFAGLRLKSNNITSNDVINGAWSADSVGTTNMPVAN